MAGFPNIPDECNNHIKICLYDFVSSGKPALNFLFCFRRNSISRGQPNSAMPTKRTPDAATLRALREMLPRVTLSDFEAICEICSRGHLRHLPPSIRAWQATTTHIRHNHTEYDTLLADGYDQEAARHFVIPEINEKLEEWGSSKTIDDRASQ